MDVRQLQYAVTLAETLHFGRAAQLNHIAQSAFSAQIARLERQVGAALFDRSSNRVTLTPAGEAFLPRAQAILAEVDAASAEARVVHQASQTHLRVGLFCESAGELTPLVIAAFRAAMPDVHLTFHELSMVDQVDALLAERVDVAFVRAPLAHTQLELVPLFAEPRYAAVGATHELADRDHVTLADLSDEPFAVAAPGAPAQWRAYWACDDVRGEPGRVATQVTNVNESLNAIAYAGAVDTFPGAATRFLQPPGVVYRPLLDATLSTLALARRTDDHRTAVLGFQRVARRLAETSLAVVPEAVPADAPDGHRDAVL